MIIVCELQWNLEDLEVQGHAEELQEDHPRVLISISLPSAPLHHTKKTY